MNITLDILKWLEEHPTAWHPESNAVVIPFAEFHQIPQEVISEYYGSGGKMSILCQRVKEETP